MSVASDEINFLVYRYLQESGFGHSAYVFGMESNIMHSNIQSSLVPPAALCTLLIKGLCYIQAEILIQEDGSVMQYLTNESLSLIDAVTPDMVLQRRKAILERIEEEQKQKELNKSKQTEKQPATENSSNKQSSNDNKTDNTRTINVVVAPSSSGEKESDKKKDGNVTASMDISPANSPISSPEDITDQKDKTNNSSNNKTSNFKTILDRSNHLKENLKSNTLEPDDSMSQGTMSQDNDSINEEKIESIPEMEPISPVCSDMETGSVSNRRDGEEVESQISQDSSYVQVRKKVRALSPNQVERNGFTSGNGRHLNVPGFAHNGTIKEQTSPNSVNHVHHHHHHHHYMDNKSKVEAKSSPFNVTSPEEYNIRSTMQRSPGNSPATAGVSSPDVDTKQLSLTAKILRGHDLEVFICSWSPTEDYLVSGSGDSTARIWDLRANGTGRQVVLKHCLKHVDNNQNQAKPTNRDVCAADWTFDGSRLATGSYDGHARIWSPEGDLKQVCGSHNGPIFALKWNKKGDRVVTSGVDKSCVVWNPENGKPVQKFSFHSQPTLDVDWQSNDTFASCSTDKEINICQIGQNTPIQTFRGHTDEVNAIRWDPAGTLLASCSDDSYLKIWTMSGLAHNIKAHDKEIYSIRWSPAGPGSRNPNARSCIASASFDCTVKIWEPDTGKMMNHLKSHDHSVYWLGFAFFIRYCSDRYTMTR